MSAAPTLFDVSAPALGADTIPLRPYQQDAIDSIRREFGRGKKRTLLVLPTGTGKTVTFGHVCRRVVERGGRALVLAHRGELIDQAANTLERIGLNVGIEKAQLYARALSEPDVVIGTVQTLQRDRLASWPRDHFRLIVVDEAHHATAETYRKILAHFDARVLGVTATADRADEDELSDVFESVAYEMSLWDAMTAPPPGPYLCRLGVVQADVQIDLRQIRTTGGDYNLGDLEKVIGPLVEILANAIKQEIGERRTICFTPDVGSATALASALQSLGLAAEWTSGDDKERVSKVGRFKEGAFQILCNCALLTEGFDCPEVAAIVLARPTKSRPLFAQMVGRGTRLARDKSDCLVVDFDYLTGKHELVRPVELFDTTHTDEEVLSLAQEIASKGEIDLCESIEQGEKLHKERQLLRIKANERKLRYRRVCYDPLEAADVLGIALKGAHSATSRPASEKQLAYLSSFGVDVSKGLSRRVCAKLLDELAPRRAKGLATYKQVHWMIAKGVEPEIARAMTFREASARLDQLFNR